AQGAPDAGTRLEGATPRARRRARARRGVAGRRRGPPEAGRDRSQEGQAGRVAIFRGPARRAGGRGARDLGDDGRPPLGLCTSLAPGRGPGPLIAPRAKSRKTNGALTVPFALLGIEAGSGSKPPGGRP